MGRPRADDRAEPTRERILAAGAAVFAERGPEATLAEIARRAGIRRPSLLYHFDSKERLYEAVVHRTFALLGRELGRAMGLEGAFRERLGSLTRAYVAFLAEHPDEARLVTRAMIEASGPGPAIVREQVGPLLESVVGYLEHAGRGCLRAGLPIRAAVLQVVADGLLQAAAVGVRDVMWGPPDPERTWKLVERLFLEAS